MVDWSKQIFFEDVEVNDLIPVLRLPLPTNRLIMAAGANRDFVAMHNDNEAGRRAGAPGMFANTWYVMGLAERMLREWIGLRGEVVRIGPFRMSRFNCPGTVTECGGTVLDKRQEGGKCLVDLDIWQDDGSGRTMVGKATVALPSKN